MTGLTHSLNFAQHAPTIAATTTTNTAVAGARATTNVSSAVAAAAMPARLRGIGAFTGIILVAFTGALAGILLGTDTTTVASITNAPLSPPPSDNAAVPQAVISKEQS